MTDGNPEALPLDDEIARGWKRTAAGAGAVALLALLLAVSVHLGKGGADPLDTPAYQAAEQALVRAPGDESVKQSIRELDLQLRREYFRRRALTRLGGAVLAVALTVFLVAVKRARPLRAPAPDVPEGLEVPNDHGRGARAARCAVAGAGLLLAAAASAIAFGARDRLPDLEALGRQGAAPVAERFPSADDLRRHWGSFRGADGSGIAGFVEAPVAWNGATGEGVLWRAELPLPGASSPIVWEDRLWVSCGDAGRQEVCCFDAASGRMLWRSPVVMVGTKMAPPEIEEETGFAACTPVTDGRRVVAAFAHGFVAGFDRDGTQLWTRNFGPLDNAYGHASSLAIWRGLVLAQFDQGHAQDGKSRLVALEVATGRTAWETVRPVDASWCSPIVVRDEAGDQVVTVASPWVIAYAPESGRELWRLGGLKGELAPSPVQRDGRLYFAHQDTALWAIRAGGTGDVTASHVLWKAADGLPDVCSPLCDGPRVYLLASDGELTCCDSATGKTLWQQELGEACYASPGLAGARLYVTSRKGVTWIIEAGPAWHELGRAELGEEVDASFAFAHGRIYVRGRRHLFAIGR